jgi:hypothetical protein
MDVEVVIAKFKENIEWIESLPFKTIIYDKSGDTNTSYIPRENVGREAETFVYHIIQNYDNIPEYTVFLQGYPFEHTPFHSTDELVEKIQREISNHPTRPIGIDNPMYECPYKFGLPVIETFMNLFHSPAPTTLHFHAGAQYLLPKACILARSKEFYEHLHGLIMRETATHFATVVYSPDKVDPWTLERLWMYIWDPSISSKM